MTRLAMLQHDRSHLHGHRIAATALGFTNHAEDTTAPEFTFVPADYTVDADEMPMDDATASDNCGEVTIEVSRNHRWRCCWQLRDRSHSRHRRRWNSATASQTITVQDTMPGVHLRPCRLHRRVFRTRCQWTTPRRLTTVVRSPSKCSSETTAGDAARQLRDRSHLHGHRRRWNSARLRRPSPFRTPQRRSSPSSLPTTPSSVQTRCQWTTPRRLTTVARSPSKCLETTAGMLLATT